MILQYLEDPHLTVEPDPEPNPGEDLDLTEYVGRHLLAWFDLLREQPHVAIRYAEIVVERRLQTGRSNSSPSSAARGTTSS